MTKKSKPQSGPESDSPELHLTLASVGRSTRAAIEADLAAEGGDDPSTGAHPDGARPDDGARSDGARGTFEPVAGPNPGRPATAPGDVDDGPEIEVHEHQPGRATMAAIDADLRDVAAAAPPRRRGGAGGQAPVVVAKGRGSSPRPRQDSRPRQATLAGPMEPPDVVKRNSPIFENTDAPTGTRRRMRTVGFSEPPPEPTRPPQAQPPQTRRGVAPPANPPRERAPSEPAVTPRSPQTTQPSLDHDRSPSVPSTMGRDTLDALEKQLESWAGGQAAGLEAADAFELVTFIVRCDPAFLASEGARREFVAKRLLRRLPDPSMDAVERIDVTPWTVRGTVIVRVWCRIE